MTTLTALSVAFNLNAAGVKAGATLARNEIRSLQKVVNDHKTAFERSTEKLTLVEKGYRAGGLAANQYAEMLRRVNAEQNKLSTSTQTLATGYSRLMSLFAALGVARLAKEAVTAAADFESLNIQFEVLLGSAEKSAKAIADMRAFAAASPLTFNDVAKGVKTMVAFGIESDRAMQVMRMLGDISLGNSERFGALALAFGQASAAGRLMGQEVLQFVNAGFNPLQEIARTTGKSMLQLKQDMENGLISAEMVFKALESATGAGGRFADMTDRLSQTASGQMAQAMDKLQQAGIQIGNELIPVLTDLLAGWKENKSLVQDVTYGVGVLVDGLRMLIGVMKDYGTIQQMIWSTGENLVKNNPLAVMMRGGLDKDAIKGGINAYAASPLFHTGGATSAALDATMIQAGRRSDLSRSRQMESAQLQYDEANRYRRSSSTNAELRAAGDWQELSRRQAEAAKAAQERNKIAAAQLAAQHETNKKLQELKPVQRIR